MRTALIATISEYSLGVTAPRRDWDTGRAALALSHGRVLEALALNPLAALTMMGGVVGGFVAPGWVALHGPLPGFDRAWSRGSRIAAWCAVAAQWAYLILVRR